MNTIVVFVHMSTNERGAQALKAHGIDNALSIADPERKLYQLFDLRKGTFGQLLGWKVFVRGFRALFRGKFPSRAEGDTRQLPGIFLLHSRKVLREFRHEFAGDRPDYLSFIRPT